VNAPHDGNSLIEPVPPEPSQSPPRDKKAEKEQKLFASTDDERREALKRTVHSGILWAVRVAAFCVILLFVVRIWHMGAPDGWRWLKNEEVQQIDHLLFSGALGAFITKYFGSTFDSKKDSDKDNGPR